MHSLPAVHADRRPTLHDTPGDRQATLIDAQARRLDRATTGLFTALEHHLTATTDTTRDALRRSLTHLAQETAQTATVLGVRIRHPHQTSPTPFLADGILRQRSTTTAAELTDLSRLIASGAHAAEVSEAIDALGSDLQLLLDRTDATARVYRITLPVGHGNATPTTPAGEVAA